MYIRIIICFSVFSFSSLHAQSNPDWNVLTPKVFALMDREIADSIAFRQSESATLRAEMEKSLTAAGLGGSDRQLIFGDEDQYFKEGMHKNFKEAPQSMYVAYDRNPAVVRLENLHVALYYSDKTLYRWLDIQKRMQGYKTREEPSKWASRFKNLPQQQKNTLIDENGQVLWAAHEVACMMASDLGGYADQNLRKVKSLELKFEPLPAPAMGQQSPALSFPIAADKLLASFPVNGQYGFCATESIPGSGYMVFPLSAKELFSGMKDKAQVFKARWTGTDQRTTYTEAELVYHAKGAVVYYTIPQLFFKGGMVYRLELVAIPESAMAPIGNDDVCWLKFRGGTAKVNTPSGRNEGETVLTEIYFRAGKYSVKDKINTLKGAVDWQAGNITYSTDEPYDRSETQGAINSGASTKFSIDFNGRYELEQKLTDKALFYYFTVPQNEDLSKLKPGELATIEKDNTLDAAFIRDVNKASPDQYIQTPDTKKGSQPIGNGYIAPAYSFAFGPDTLITDKPIPFISRTHFESKKPLNDAFKCTLKIGEMKQLIQAVAIQQRQIQQRMEERANFFYALELRKSKRSGTAPAGDLEYFKQKEKDSLPPAAKYFLSLDIAAKMKAEFSVTVYRNFPGDEQRTAILPVKF